MYIHAHNSTCRWFTAVTKNCGGVVFDVQVLVFIIV